MALSVRASELSDEQIVLLASAIDATHLEHVVKTELTEAQLEIMALSTGADTVKFMLDYRSAQNRIEFLTELLDFLATVKSKFNALKEN
jgi:hypothetical protein